MKECLNIVCYGLANAGRLLFIDFMPEKGGNLPIVYGTSCEKNHPKINTRQLPETPVFSYICRNLNFTNKK